MLKSIPAAIIKFKKTEAIKLQFFIDITITPAYGMAGQIYLK